VRDVRRAQLVAAIGKPCTYCGEPMVGADPALGPFLCHSRSRIGIHSSLRWRLQLSLQPTARFD
jgi:hypothetical protein